MIADLIARLERVRALAAELRPLLADMPGEWRAGVLAELTGDAPAGTPPG